VSKADLLSPTELRQTTVYAERQLATRANLKLLAHPVSVLGQSANLCDQWLERELMPLVESHREQAAAALKRKVGALREAVIKALEARLGVGRQAGPPASTPSDQETITALRKADAFLEAAQRESQPVLDGVSSLSNELLDLITAGLAVSWTSPGVINTGEAVSTAINRVLTSQVVKLTEVLSAARLELSRTLKLADEAVLGAGGGPEALPMPAGAPIPDLTPLLDRLNLNRPRFLSKLGKRLIRGHLRQQLERQVEPAMTKLLGRYGRRLREWFGRSIVELRDAFAARAGIYRAQLEARGSPARIAETRTELEANLRILQNW
jgi:hypothetical protein